jgi:hypothetical protein
LQVLDDEKEPESLHGRLHKKEGHEERGDQNGNIRRVSQRLALKSENAVQQDIDVHDIRVLDAGLAGFGLFISGHVPKNTVVARMGISIKDKREVVEARMRDVGLPHDACVHSQRCNSSYYDATFTTVVTPEWYYMNHDCSPNCKMVLVGDSVCWSTLRAVRDEQLTFAYDAPDAGWCLCEAGCYTKDWKLE